MSRTPRHSSPGEPKAKIDSVSDSGSPAGRLTFEQALAELEKLVGGMEGGDLSLEQSLAAHKRGLELARFCQEQLESAQQQVRVLEGEVLKSLATGAVQPAADASAASDD